MKSPFPGMDPYLGLRPLIDACYRDGRYRTIDDHRPLNPPFTDDERKWFYREFFRVGR